MLKNRRGNFLFVNTRLLKVPKALVVFTHGLHDCCARYAPLGDALVGDRFSFCSWDLEGHGKSDGDSRGALDDGQCAVDDLLSVIRHARERSGNADTPLILMGKAVGALLTTVAAARIAAGHESASGIPVPRAVVLLSPAAKIDSAYSSALVYLNAFAARVAPSAPVSWIKPGAISDIPAECEAYAAHEDVVHGCFSARTASAVLRLLDDNGGALRDLGGAALVVLAGTGDRVVDPRGALVCFDVCPSPCKILVQYSGAPHDLAHSTVAKAAVGDCVALCTALAAAKGGELLTAAAGGGDGGDPVVLESAPGGEGRLVSALLPPAFAKGNGPLLRRVAGGQGKEKGK